MGKKWGWVVKTIVLFCTHQISHAMTFDFDRLGKSNQIEIRLKTGFGSGSVKGSISRVRGKINFLAELPQEAKGRIDLDASSLRFGNLKVSGDAHSLEWLNTSLYPTISFQLQGFKNPRWNGKSLFVIAHGKLSLKESSSSVLMPLTVRYFRKHRRRFDGLNGDLLVLEGESSISRNLFGINPASPTEEVGDKIMVRVKLVGCSDKVRPFLPSALFLR